MLLSGRQLSGRDTGALRIDGRRAARRRDKLLDGILSASNRGLLLTRWQLR
jgi:hypothetical protein